MDTLLSIIAVLGIGALMISAWVFMGAAKRYVSGEDLDAESAAMDGDLSPYRHWTERAHGDRRQNRSPVVFPITVNGVRIDRDRRTGSDRRQAA